MPIIAPKTVATSESLVIVDHSRCPKVYRAGPTCGVLERLAALHIAPDLGCILLLSLGSIRICHHGPYWLIIALSDQRKTIVSIRPPIEAPLDHPAPKGIAVVHVLQEVLVKHMAEDGLDYMSQGLGAVRGPAYISEADPAVLATTTYGEENTRRLDCHSRVVPTAGGHNPLVDLTRPPGM